MDKTSGPRGRVLAAALALLLAACGGGGGDSANESPPTVARIEVTPAAALLPAAGASAAFRAQAYDAAGRALDVPVAWSSSRPAQVAVDAAGRATAQVAAGSAQIRASAGGVQSAPVLALAATPAAGVVLVADDSIVGEPADADAAAEPAASNRYQVSLAGSTPPAVGSLLLGSGEKPLAGRVVAVLAEGPAQHRVTLELVPAPQLLAQFELVERFDLLQAGVAIPAEVEAAYTVQREGTRWSFTPRPPQTSSARKHALASGERDLPPFRRCKVETSGFAVDSLPLSLSAPPTVTIDIHPGLDVDWRRAGGLRRFVVEAAPKVTVQAGLEGSAAFEAEVECLLQLLTLRIPVAGPAAFFIGGTIPVGVGIDLSAKVTAASFKVTTRAEAEVELRAGIDCSGASGCSFVGTADNGRARLEPTIDPPNVFEDTRIELGLEACGWIAADIGNPFLRTLRFRTIEASAGARLEADLAPPAVQLRDAAYASDYGAAGFFEAKAGLFIEELLQLLGLANLGGAAVEVELPLADSPQVQTLSADRAAFNAGDTVRVRVQLDAATLDFVPGQGNVASVQIRRRVGQLTELLASQDAAAGQTEFVFDIVAAEAGNAAQWFAFVTTRLLPSPLLSLELGSFGSDGLTVADVIDIEPLHASCRALVLWSDTPEGDLIEREDREAPSAVCQAAQQGSTARAEVQFGLTVSELMPGMAVGSAPLVLAANAVTSAEQRAVRPANTDYGEDVTAEAIAAATLARMWVLTVGNAPQRLVVAWTDSAIADSPVLQVRVVTGNSSRLVWRPMADGLPLDVVLQPGETVVVNFAVSLYSRVVGQSLVAGSSPSSDRRERNFSATLMFSPPS